MDVRNLIKPLGPQSFLLGIGVAAAAYLLGPQLKEALRPAAVKGAQGVMALGGKTKQLLDQGKEKMNEMVFEKPSAENTRNMIQAEVAGVQEKLLKELRDERENSNKILEELKNSVISLKEELAHMKKDTDPLES